MTDQDDAAAAELAELRRLQHQLHAAIRELVTILGEIQVNLHGVTNKLTVIQGETDLSLEYMKTRLEGFYRTFPDFSP